MRLAIFDVDGTLIDTERAIIDSLSDALAEMSAPPRAEVELRRMIGLSLPEVSLRLLAERSEAHRAAFVDRYQRSFARRRRELPVPAFAPLYPGAEAALARLDEAGWLMALATGKSRFSLNLVLDAYAVRTRFVVTQSADDAPAKPSPEMVFNCLRTTGVGARDAVVIGDTEHDMAMARNAGTRAIGAGWGFHDAHRLMRGGADTVIASFDDLDAALSRLTLAR